MILQSTHWRLVHSGCHWLFLTGWFAHPQTYCYQLAIIKTSSFRASTLFEAGPALRTTRPSVKLFQFFFSPDGPPQRTVPHMPPGETKASHVMKPKGRGAVNLKLYIIHNCWFSVELYSLFSRWSKTTSMSPNPFHSLFPFFYFSLLPSFTLKSRAFW